MRNLYSILIMAICLTGCATTSNAPPSISYYLLDEAQPTQAGATTAKSVAVAPVVLAEYLSLPNLVLKQSDHRITVASYHLWADPLAPSIKRAIKNDLSMEQPQISFVDTCTSCDLITLYVDHFYPEQAGDAVLAGRYTIKRTNGKTEDQAFILRAPLKSDGYPAAVQQMRLLVSELAEGIGGKL